jgi:GcrA cell cycle regulator
MQSTGWTPAHSEALREYLARGMSFSEIADAINVKFKTAYSRSAAIGRAKRLGLAGPNRPKDFLMHWPKLPPKAKAPRLQKPRERYVPESLRPMPVFERTETVKLRCVEIDPRHLVLTDLEPGDCRYPYGGDQDGEVITFCGHPRRRGLSYCAPHFHLTRGPGTTSERVPAPSRSGSWRQHETGTETSGRRRHSRGRASGVTQLSNSAITEAIQHGTGQTQQVAKISKSS